MRFNEAGVGPQVSGLGRGVPSGSIAASFAGSTFLQAPAAIGWNSLLGSASLFREGCAADCEYPIHGIEDRVGGWCPVPRLCHQIGQEFHHETGQEVGRVVDDGRGGLRAVGAAGRALRPREARDAGADGRR